MQLRIVPFYIHLPFPPIARTLRAQRAQHASHISHAARAHPENPPPTIRFNTLFFYPPCVYTCRFDSPLFARFAQARPGGRDFSAPGAPGASRATVALTRCPRQPVRESSLDPSGPLARVRARSPAIFTPTALRAASGGFPSSHPLQFARSRPRWSLSTLCARLHGRGQRRLPAYQSPKPRKLSQVLSTLYAARFGEAGKARPHSAPVAASPRRRLGGGPPPPPPARLGPQRAPRRAGPEKAPALPAAPRRPISR